MDKNENGYPMPDMQNGVVGGVSDGMGGGVGSGGGCGNGCGNGCGCMDYNNNHCGC